MTSHKTLKYVFVGLLSLTVAACGGKATSTSVQQNSTPPKAGDAAFEFNNDVDASRSEKSSLWDAFGSDKGEQTANVNRYLWSASLEVLNFLPVQSVDPYTGVIVTGYGTPPGGRRAYRATVHIKDPALDARSLSVSLQSKGGGVNPATARAVEDAILSRARQLRIADGKL